MYDFMIELTTKNIEETQEIASIIGEMLADSVCLSSQGICVALQGDLGAGKTFFVQQIAKVVQVDGQDVVSPTFSIVHEYNGMWKDRSLSILHMDLYRLEAEDIPNLALEEMLEEQSGLAFVEWATMFPYILPKNTMHIHIEHHADTEEGRKIRIHTTSTFLQDALQKCAVRCNSLCSVEA